MPSNRKSGSKLKMRTLLVDTEFLVVLNNQNSIISFVTSGGHSVTLRYNPSIPNCPTFVVSDTRGNVNNSGTACTGTDFKVVG